jgi:4-hydroxy-tetrahydrodipicolinate synthase
VDEAAYRNVLSRLAKAGVHGIFVGGSAGEGPLLAWPEWKRMVEIAFDEAGEKVMLLGGVSDTSTAKVLEKTSVLRSIGYGWFVVTPTFYIALNTAEEHLRLFGRAREAGGDMEMIAYNIPKCVGSVIEADTMLSMARQGWIRVCKESSGDVDYLKRLLNEGPELGLGVLVGDEPLVAMGLQLGGKGIVPVCGNYDPALFLTAYETAGRGEESQLTALQERIMYIRERLVLGGPCWLAGIKYAVSALGIGNGRVVSPLAPAPADQRKVLDELIREDEMKA